MITVRRSTGPDDRSPGVWIPLATSRGRSASIVCPKCGQEAMLTNHKIGADGAVTPSVVCPRGCGWHEHVRLDGWTG